MSFLVVHSIPSPYRLHLFRCLRDALERQGRTFEVWFMARGQHDRPATWGVGEDYGFAHRFFTDVGPRIGNKKWHANPGLAVEVARRRPAFLLVGGLWDSLTSPAVLAMHACGVQIGWYEPNQWTRRQPVAAIVYAKRAMLHRCDFIAVPGQQGRAFTSGLLGETTRPPIVVLPNLVDERRFCLARDEASAERIRSNLSVPDGDRLALWPARLIEAKGLIEFVDHLNPDILSGWSIRIVGEGPLRAQLSTLILRRELHERIAIQPYVAYDEMPGLYRAADLFLLPSIHDPNPLSVVEAMHSGLPMLVSNRIGNHPEAVREGENAWTVDPFSPDSVRRGVDAAFGASDETLRRMGQRSREIAADFWDSDRAIAGFLRAVGAT